MSKFIQKIINWWNCKSEANISKYTHMEGNYDSSWGCFHIEGHQSEAFGENSHVEGITMSKSLEYAKNKIKAIDPHIIVSRNIYKPYYSIRYYDLSDNIWHIGFSSSELKFVTEWLKTEFEIVESDIEPVRHGK